MILKKWKAEIKKIIFFKQNIYINIKFYGTLQDRFNPIRIFWGYSILNPSSRLYKWWHISLTEHLEYPISSWKFIKRSLSRNFKKFLCIHKEINTSNTIFVKVTSHPIFNKYIIDSRPIAEKIREKKQQPSWSFVIAYVFWSYYPSS